MKNSIHISIIILNNINIREMDYFKTYVLIAIFYFLHFVCAYLKRIDIKVIYL